VTRISHQVIASSLPLTRPNSDIFPKLLRRSQRELYAPIGGSRTRRDHTTVDGLAVLELGNQCTGLLSAERSILFKVSVTLLVDARKSTYSRCARNKAQSTDAAATRADEKNVPPQPDHGDHPPLQLDTGSSSQSSELACDESSSVSQDSANAISATSRPEPGNTFCPDIATVQDHSAADSAQQRRNLKRTYVRSEHFLRLTCDNRLTFHKSECGARYVTNARLSLCNITNLHSKLGPSPPVSRRCLYVI